MLKILLYLGILLVTFWILISKKRSKQSPKSKPNPSHDDPMVECKTCKTFVCQSQSILSNGAYFCSKECLLKE